MDKVYQEPLYAYQMYPNSSKLYYAYACNGCGVEVKGYYQKRIKGHTWCYKCNRKNETERQRNKKIESENQKLQDFAQWLFLVL